MASQPEQLPWQIAGEPPASSPAPLRSIIFFSGCTWGRKAGQSQSHMENCLILIKYESKACHISEGRL